jgi:hypothetical protein
MKIDVWAYALVLALSTGSAARAAESVVTYHNSLDRHGAYTVPGLTLAAAAKMHLDKGFHATLDGHVYAQPLYWHPASGNDEVIAATESNEVYALDAKTGAQTWHTQLPASVPLSDLQCGNIDPVGVTGTPVIDLKAGVVYIDALTNSSKSGIRHLVYALSLVDGTVLKNWPLDVAKALHSQGVSFPTNVQSERSALLLFGGQLYVNYGGYYGDCGSYHGTVIQIDPSKVSLVANWLTRATGGGIWAQGGMAGDGKALYLTTGNTFSAQSWEDGEAIIRLKPGLKHSTDSRDYFTPSNWQELDNSDQDLGGTEALPLDIAVQGSPPAKRVLALGKDGNAYLADRTNLGGVGGQLAVASVSNGAIRTAAAVYSTSSGTMVAFTNYGSSSCSGTSITMLNVAASGSQLISEAWCTKFSGQGAPIISTTDGKSNPIVWVVGAEGDDVLHGFNAASGQAVYSGTDTMSGLHHFETIMAAGRRFYVGADGAVYAFTF